MNQTVEETIKKIGSELDADITAWMLEVPAEGSYKRWELLTNPVDNMLEWQAMRDRKINK